LEEQKQLKRELASAQFKRTLLELNCSAWDSLCKVENEVERFKHNQDGIKKQHYEINGKENRNEIKTSSEKNSTENENDSTCQSTTVDLERAAQRLAQVMFITSQSEHHDMPLLRQIAARTRGLEKSLTEQLEHALAAEIVPEDVTDEFSTGNEKREVNKDALTRILRSYVAINKVNAANEVIRRLLILPILEKTFTFGRLDGGVRGSCLGLGSMYSDVLKFVIAECTPIVQVIKATNEGLAEQFDLVGNGIGESVHEILITNLTDVFSSGVADTLHYSYTATEAFFKVLSRISLNPDYTMQICKRTLANWNLDVYLELRTLEMMTSLEETLEESVLEHIWYMHDNEDVPYVLASTRSLWTNFLKCRDKEKIFLQPVAAGLFKISLQLLHCYTSWAEDGSKQSTNLNAWEQDKVPCKIRVYLAKDCESLSQRLLETEVNLLRGYIYGGREINDDDCEDHISRALKSISDRLLVVSETCFDTIKKSLGEECVEGLAQHLKSTVGIYRLSNHKAPSKASSFVSTILKPYKDFLEEHPNESKDMGVNVVGHVAKEYASQANKICEEVKNTEAALRRFRKNKNKDKDSTLPSTAESLKLQFKLDMQELRKCAIEVGVDVENISEFQRLEKLFESSESDTVQS